MQAICSFTIAASSYRVVVHTRLPKPYRIQAVHACAHTDDYISVLADAVASC
jgi:hypothetical protein